MKPFSSAFVPALGLLGAALGVAPTLAQSIQPQTQPTGSGVPAQFQWGDFDADGLDDAVAITANGALSLLHNAGDGSFADVTQSMGIDVQGARFAVWEDYDKDGLVDLFVGTASGSGRLLHNAGAFFADVTDSSGLNSPGFDEAARWIDYDDDGLLDLHLVQASSNTLYHALAPGGFESVALPRLTAAASGGAIVTRAAADRDAAVIAPAGEPADRAKRRPGSGDSLAASAGGRTPVGGALGSGGGAQNMGSIVPGWPQCTRFIQDDATGQCMAASSTATLGMLYPLSSDLYVDAATGNVGIGTTSPGNPRLRVEAPAAGTVAIASGGALAIAHDLQASGGPALFFGPTSVPTAGLPSTSMTFRADGIEHSGFTYTPDFGGNSRIDMNFGASFEQSLNPARFSFTSAGRLGVGTTTPTANLDVDGNAKIGSSLDVDGPVTVSTNWGYFMDGWDMDSFAGNMRLNETNVGTRLAIAPGGNVGIGTSTPTSKLSVSGSADISGKVGIGLPGPVAGAFFMDVNSDQDYGLRVFNFPADSIGGLLGAWYNDSSDGARIRFASTAGNWDLGQTAGDDFIINGGGGNIGIKTLTPANTLSVNGTADISGNVGIGTATPAKPLHIDSNTSLPVQIDGTNNPGLKMNNLGAGSSWSIYHSSTDNLNFRDSTTGVTRMVIGGSSGSVAIGNGDSTGPGTLFVNGTAFKPGGGSWSNSSDRRLKKDIQDLEGALDTLLALRGVTFEYKDPEAIGELSGERIGFIAQEVEAVMPDWVHEVDGYKRLTIRGFESLAVESLRELSEENAELAAANEELEARVARLEGLEGELATLRASLATLIESR